MMVCCVQEDGDVIPVPRQRRRKAAPERAPPMMSPIKSLFGRRVGGSSFGTATSIFQSIHQANAGESPPAMLAHSPPLEFHTGNSVQSFVSRERVQNDLHD